MNDPRPRWTEEELKERSRKATARKNEIKWHRAKHMLLDHEGGVEHPDWVLAMRYKPKRYL